MHRLGINLTGSEEIADMSGNAIIEKGKPDVSDNPGTMKIKVVANGKATVFELNGSRAAKDLYAQLPFIIPVGNYGNNEKIFYPPQKLDATDVPIADARPGTFAYYAPWGDVVMFYHAFGSAEGLYQLGRAVSGGEYIQEMSGTVKIEKIN